MERGQFTFYESFEKAALRIKKTADRCKFFEVIAAYALHSTIPDFDSLPETVALAFELVQPTLDSSRRKAESGKRGGKGKANASKPEANESKTKQTQANASKPEAFASEGEKENEKEKEGEKEIEKENENECSPPTPSPKQKGPSDDAMIMEKLGQYGPDLHEAVASWLRYKKQKRQGYQPEGLNSLLSRINKAVNEYGVRAVIDVIEASMSSNYQGIVWDQLKDQKQHAAGQNKTAQKLQANYERLQRWAEKES